MRTSLHPTATLVRGQQVAADGLRYVYTGNALTGRGRDPLAVRCDLVRRDATTSLYRPTGDGIVPAVPPGPRSLPGGISEAADSGAHRQPHLHVRGPTDSLTRVPPAAEQPAVAPIITLLEAYGAGAEVIGPRLAETLGVPLRPAGGRRRSWRPANPQEGWIDGSSPPGPGRRGGALESAESGNSRCAAPSRGCWR
jgi:hypothetical protein